MLQGYFSVRWAIFLSFWYETVQCSPFLVTGTQGSEPDCPGLFPLRHPHSQLVLMCYRCIFQCISNLSLPFIASYWVRHPLPCSGATANSFIAGRSMQSPYPSPLHRLHDAPSTLQKSGPLPIKGKSITIALHSVFFSDSSLPTKKIYSTGSYLSQLGAGPSSTFQPPSAHLVDAQQQNHKDVLLPGPPAFTHKVASAQRALPL